MRRRMPMDKAEVERILKPLKLDYPKNRYYFYWLNIFIFKNWCGFYEGFISLYDDYMVIMDYTDEKYELSVFYTDIKKFKAESLEEFIKGKEEEDADG
jgi:hypothetical protein